ncbi:MAG: hypothetical protein IKD46_08470 [Lentisphaeria bacterium]|nr:hypothetical protein [Lentisphaeria bacterium]
MICLNVKKGDRISVAFSEIYFLYGNSANIKMDFNIAVDSKAIKWIWYFDAIADGPVTMNFKSIESQKSFNIIPISPRGTDTLFHRAAKNHQWLKMRYLLESGVQIDCKGAKQRRGYLPLSALQVAITAAGKG